MQREYGAKKTSNMSQAATFEKNPFSNSMFLFRLGEDRDLCSHVNFRLDRFYAPEMSTTNHD